MQDRLAAMEKVNRATQQAITISTNLSNVLGDTITGNGGGGGGDDTTRTIKELLGTDWDKAVGIKEAEAQLRISEDQAEALLDGNRALFERLESQRQYIRDLIEIDALTDAISKAEARLVEYAGDEELLGRAQVQLQEFRNQLLERELSLEEKLVTTGNDAFRADMDAAMEFAKVVQGVEPLARELTKTEELINSIGGTIQTGLVDAITTAVTETDRLGEAFRELGSDLAKTIGRALILNAITSATREAMSAGTISSDDAFQENAQSINTTNNYIRGVGEAQAQEAAFSSMAAGDGTIKFESMNIGGMDVVTREEAIAIGQESAKQARAQVFNDLKNKPARRAQIGLR